ncbi:type III pantothenate kinase [Planctomicrobium sp. SH668]|uniref:type III pantothenate kinase n=1 Tax=Planctomicrobium sp. SH668 TaxID=3448126 RepID=UPI003F5CAD22
MSYYSLLADAGHTRIKVALCRQDSEINLPVTVQSTAAIYGKPIDWASVRRWCDENPPAAVIITGTNAVRAAEAFENWPADLPAPYLLSDKSCIPLKVDVDFPQKVGIDRLLNCVAANLLRNKNQPALIVDSGTAITVDVVDAGGIFRGGAILPGILLGAKSLHEETTTLPHVDVWELLKNEPAVVGRNTEAAIASGLYWGHLGAVKEMLARSAEWLESVDEKPMILLTGGASGILAPYLDYTRVEWDLALQGLAIVARLLQSQRSE